MKAKDTPSAPLPRWRRVGGALLRAGLAVSFVAALAGGWLYHSARAQIDENLLSLGARMMAYDGASHQDAPRDLLINGQVLRLSSGMTDHPALEVLDFFEARCAAADGELALQIERALADHPEIEDAAPDSPTIREDNGRVGYVACLDLGPNSIDVAELARRLGEFGRTGDVAAIGDARYVFVEQSGQGEELGTHFVAMWTEGEFNVNTMFPEEGDAPGVDVEGVSRPPRSRRVLSGHERGMPHSMTVYSTRLSEADLEAFYRRDLGRNGWSLLELPEPTAGEAPPTLIAERGERMVTLMFQPDAEVGGSTVAIFDAR